MNSVGYVILHYKALNDTIECVESIKYQHGSGRTKIVVVDNHSPDGSGEDLIERFKDDLEVEIILSNKNVGFARGLNLGIRYLRENCGMDFIVLLNNDTVLQSECWDEIIKSTYMETNFGVLGPDIISLDGLEHQNPMVTQDISIPGMKKMIRDKRVKYVLSYTYLRNVLRQIRRFYNRCSANVSIESKQNVLHELKFDVQLQGSCLILSPRYFKYYEGLYEGTYLYFEEAIIKYRCDKVKMPICINPKIVLVHKGSVSVKDTYSNERKRELFYLSNSLQSVQSFLKSRIEGKE